MSNAIVALLFIFSVFMLFLLLSIIMFTIALLIYSPKGKGAEAHGMKEKKTEEGEV